MMCKNLSLPFQDIYYDLLLARTAITSCSSIKYVFAGGGLYYFHSDLSRNKVERDSLINKVYYPLFHDAHNWSSPNEEKTQQHELYDQEQMGLLLFFTQYLKNNGEYFHKNNKRSDNKVEYEKGKDIEWHKRSPEQRNEWGRLRATAHNKNLKFHESYNENIQYVNNFVEYCNSKNIKFIFLLFPQTDSYLRHLSFELREEFVKAINRIEEDFYFIDLSQKVNYQESDFVDMDHLGDSGAEKTCNFLQTVDFNNLQTYQSGPPLQASELK